ncbi:hypothetical protein ACSBR1_017513 [Camellia fascicularis]
MVSKYPGEVSVLALGPLTNFALAMKRDSSFASKVKRVVILGGSFFALGNVNPAAEANSLGVEAYTSWQGLNLKLCYNKARRRRVQVVLYSLITIVMVFFLFSTYRHWTQHRMRNLMSPDNICQQVKKLGQNPGCLCAVMLSDTAKFLSNLFGVPCKSNIGLRLDLLLGLFYALIMKFVFAFGNGQKLGVFDGIIVHEQPLFYEEPDVHENMRLDVDDMSYEELLALEDQIGNVSTGLSEEAILAAVRRHFYLSMKLGPPVEEEPCCICQEDYVERSSVSGNSYPKSEIICQSVVPVNFSPVPLASELIP